MIYLDNAASTPVLECARAAAEPFLWDRFGNPSSIHSEGRRAALAIIGAREKCAAAIGADTEEIVFTSVGTESDNMAIRQAAVLGKASGKRRIVASAIEHPAVLNTCKSLEKIGFEIVYIGVDGNGYVDMQQARRLITPETAVVSVMAANNEVGTIQPIRELADICHERGVLFHTDAVQAAGHIPLDVGEIGCDMMSVSAHKLGGLRGAGLIYIRKGTELQPLIFGGGQENGMRSGTENTAAIAAMGAAIEWNNRDITGRAERVARLRDRLIAGLLEIPGSRLNGGISPRVCGNVNVSFAGVEGESLVLGLDIRGVCGSSGSACASGDEEPSHVLRAMGVPEDMLKGSLRLTLSEINTADEVDLAIRAVRETVDTLRKLRGWTFHTD